MQTLPKEILSGFLLTQTTYRIIRKDGGTRKTKHLSISKKLLDILMGFTKLTAMTFIKNKYEFFIL